MEGSHPPYAYYPPVYYHYRGTHQRPYNARPTHHYYQQPPYPPPQPYSPQPYSPSSYSYPSPSAPVFTPSWQQQQQPISPLPKQLSMPPPQNENVVPPSSSYSQIGTISSSPSVPAPLPNPTPKWAIWSRRPQDPSHAPSIIISPRARPPPDVVQQALDLKTPPPSPPPVTRELVAREPPVVSSIPSSSSSTDTTTIPNSPSSSHTSVSVAATSALPPRPALSVTEEKGAATLAEPELEASIASDEPNVPAILTPASPSPPVIEEKIAAAPPSAEPNASITNDGPTVSAIPTPSSPSPTPSSAPAPATPPAPAPAPAPKKSWASLLRPTTTTSPSPSTRNALPTSSVVGFSIPASTSPGPVSLGNKSELVALLTVGPSGSSLSSSSSSTAAAAVRGNVPASASASAPASGAPLKIRPRGLINSGNMCFANSVLQIMVYCPPFHRLFVELGRVLAGASSSSAGGAVSTPSGSVSGGRASSGSNVKDKERDREKERDDKIANSSTPLVDATIEFLREFVVEDKVSKGGNGHAHPNGYVNGAGRGKGKERDLRDDDGGEEDRDWDEAFLPTYVYDAMKVKKRFDNMRGGHQEDAEEFFGFYLDTLEEELLSILHAVSPPRPTPGSVKDEEEKEKEEAAPPEDDGWLEVGRRNRSVLTRTTKATESPITRIFGGKFRSTLRTPGQKDSVVVEDWRSLRLDIQADHIHTIQDALSHIAHPQPVQITHKSGVSVDAQQQVLIEAPLPPVLVLHIKRFCYDTASGGAMKVGKRVMFGGELEIGPDVMVPAAKKALPARYKLFGVLYHHGLSASGGHYTLDVLHPNRFPHSTQQQQREGWIRIDDNLVSDVRPEDVFGAYERDDARCAYLLFYRRV